MNYRTFGRTNINVSEIGFGAWGIGKALWKGAEDDESLRALNAAIDMGLNFIDTALAYGNGHSEQLIAQLLKERSERIYVASKVPPKNFKWPAQPGIPIENVFPPDHLTICTEKSLKNLDVDCLDVQQMHVWNDEWLSDPEWFAPIEKLKRDGKIQFFGVSINDYQPENAIQLIETGLVDTVQVIFNIFEQTPAEKLFPACIKHNIGVIVRVPLDEGGLSGKINRNTTFPSGDFRNSYFRGDRKQKVEEQVKKLEEFLGSEAESIPELALKFSLGFEAVSTIIPGMRTVNHAKSNCAISDKPRLSPATISKLGEHADNRNYYLDD